MDPWNEESHLGPPSEQLSILQFIEQTKRTGLLDEDKVLGDVITSKWLSVSEHERVAIEGECSIDDLVAQSAEHFSDPAFRALLGIWQDESVLRILESNVLALDKECKDWMRKALAREEKRRAVDSAEQQVVRQQLNDVKLEIWEFDADAVHYVVRPAAESVNTLVEIKEACYPTPHAVDNTNDVLLTVSVFRYSQNRAAPILRLGAQYIFLASHTLGDLLDLMSCPSNDIPSEIVDEHDNIVDYETDVKMDSGACVIGFEAPSDASDLKTDVGPTLNTGLVFGDGMSDTDYADRYLSYIKTKMTPGEEQTSSDAPQRHLERGPTCMADTPFHNLMLRLHFPYLLIHQGNCQHYFSIDQVRLRQAPDPPKSQFPLTTFTSAKQRANCRICAKWPASLSVVGDARMAETPCLICGRCWDRLGKPLHEEGVLVVPLAAGEMP